MRTEFQRFRHSSDTVLSGRVVQTGHKSNRGLAPSLEFKNFAHRYLFNHISECNKKWMNIKPCTAPFYLATYLGSHIECQSARLLHVVYPIGSHSPRRSSKSTFELPDSSDSGKATPFCSGCFAEP